MILPRHILSAEYSTTEREAGKWIDGKTVYRKTFTRSGALPQGNTNISIGATIDTCINFSGGLLLGNNIFPLPFVRVDPNVSPQVELRIVGSNTLRVVAGDTTFDNPSVAIWVTLYYTKS